MCGINLLCRDYNKMKKATLFLHYYMMHQKQRSIRWRLRVVVVMCIDFVRSFRLSSQK